MAFKVWNGSAWTQSAPRVWDGSTWTLAKAAKVWTGSAWSADFLYTDTQTVTVGSTSGGSDPWYGYEGYLSGTIGSITDGTSNLYSGASIYGIYHYFYATGVGVPVMGANVTETTYFVINSVVSNSGWSVMYINNVKYLRTDATFSTGSGRSTWAWAMGSYFNQGGPAMLASPFTVSPSYVRWF